jgi:hypothetical protein
MPGVEIHDAAGGPADLPERRDRRCHASGRIRRFHRMPLISAEASAT